MEYKLHRIVRLEGGKIQWVPCKGTEAKIEGLDLYYVKKPYSEENKYWLIEKRTGVSLAEGTKIKCKKDFKEKLSKKGIEKIKQSIDNTVEIYGESPSYNNIAWNPAHKAE